MTKLVSKQTKLVSIVLVQAILFAVALGGIGWTDVEFGIRDDRLIDAVIGIAAGGFSYLALLTFVKYDLAPAGALRRAAQEIRPVVSDFGYGAMLIVALAASIGEELLFRVFLQSWIANLTSPWNGIIAGATAFALTHASSMAYLI